DLWRLRLRRRVRRRAQIQGDAPVPGGADLDQPYPVLRRRARPRTAPLLLGRGRRALLKAEFGSNRPGVDVALTRIGVANIGDIRIVETKAPGTTEVISGAQAPQQIRFGFLRIGV